MTNEHQPKPSPEHDEYWTYHISLLRILRAMDVRIPVGTRLDLFWLYACGPKVYTQLDGDGLPVYLELIERMVGLRVNGLEPPNRKGRYV